MPDLHLATGAYALDALDDVERRAVRRHLRGCAACTEEVREFHEATAMLADRVAQRPPESLRTGVLEQISRTRQVSPDGMPRLPGLSWRAVLTSAAAVLIAVSAAVGGVSWQGHRSAQQAQVEAARFARVMTAPGVEKVLGRPSVGGNAAVYVSGGQAVFAADQLPALSRNRSF